MAAIRIQHLGSSACFSARCFTSELGQQEVSGANLLVAIFSEQESQAVYFLKSQSISRLDVVNFITHGIGKDGEESVESTDALSDSEDVRATAEKRPLDAYATNLNAEAEAGNIDPLIGRLTEVERVARFWRGVVKITRFWWASRGLERS